MISLILTLITVTSGAVYDTQNFYLGPNQFNNSDFMMPFMGGSVYQTVYIPPSWECTPLCMYINLPPICTFYGLNCQMAFTQGIDLALNPTDGFSLLSTVVNLPQNGTYVLSFEWMPPINNTIGQQLEVRINNTAYTVIGCWDRVFTSRIEEFLLSLPAGDVNFTFTQIGAFPSMSKGITISNIKFHEVLPKIITSGPESSSESEKNLEKALVALTGN